MARRKSTSKLRYLLLTLNSFATVPCESSHARSVRFHGAPDSVHANFDDIAATDARARSDQPSFRCFLKPYCLAASVACCSRLRAIY
ncbi:hypothetical protein AVEN_202498-1 [Araneus ventricosus]|uniref:Secreted protein n=1 Tax=Araneus ventricosus TaxID=182803 RepID=A0A4Y2WVX4_ARAVE|nr:hypothetical protein AVEN_202498-1 [Araneus ventricosus]